MSLKRSLRGLAQLTVWGSVARERIPESLLGVYRYVLPFKYFVIGLYGLMSINSPLTSIDIIFGWIYGDIWSVSLMLAGFGAFIGIAFYHRLIWLELISVSVMVTLMGLYVVAIFSAAFWYGETFKFLSLLLVLVFLPTPTWRAGHAAKELRPPRDDS